MMIGDWDLLRQYCNERSEAAFAALVDRHLPLVYSAALRQVRAPELAEEVCQAVFCALAKAARQLKENTVLQSWLYTVTCRTAVDVIRRESRRQHRERVASGIIEMQTDAGQWKELEPLLDELMRELDDGDRTLILLRYFENKSFRELGETLGISDDAAQKRSARAIDRLRELFRKRSVSVSAAALGTALSSNAVAAAPQILAASVTAGATAGIAYGVTTVTAKGIAMTAIQKTVVGVAIAVIGGAGYYQSHQAKQLRRTRDAAEQHAASIAADLEESLREREAAAARLEELRAENARLTRDMAGARAHFQQQAVMVKPAVASLAAGVQPNDQAEPAVLSVTDGERAGRELGQAVIRGEPGALDRLREMSRATMSTFTINRNGLTDQQREALHRQTFAPMREAFAVIDAAAVQGNEVALRAIADATQLPELKGRATTSLGKLAGRGDQAALDLLLSGDSYGLLRSSVVSALKPAAENGNQRAIDALASVARDTQSQGLWFMAADALAGAAEAGNPVAVDALAELSNSATNKSVYNAVLSGLQRAAYKGNVTAEAALRKMGVAVR